MARWDPGAEERLRKAALELYRERGFENVSAAEISERAGLTRRTFFRYFADKREVLFADSERLPIAVADAVRDADPALSPCDTALQALAAVGALVVERVEPWQSRERRAVIDASPELRERERTKLAECTTALATGLCERGATEDAAALLARVGVAILETAFARWAVRGDFPACFTEAVGQVAAGFSTPAVSTPAVPTPRTAGSPSE